MDRFASALVELYPADRVDGSCGSPRRPCFDNRFAQTRITIMSDELQKQFGSDQIQFNEGKGGLTKIAISNSAGTAEVYLHGAHVTQFQPAGQQPVLYMSSTSLFK